MSQTGVQLAGYSQQHEININTPQPNLPLPDLFVGSRENYIQFGVPLYEASVKGDWKAAKAILDENPALIRCSITENCETALHVAASGHSTKLREEFVKNLVHLMEKEDLELQNKNFNTALCLASMAGNVKMATIMVEKNNTLLSIPGSQGMMPLYKNSNKLQDNGWTHQNRCWLLSSCVRCGLYDVALQMVKDCQELSGDGSVLGVLAQTPYGSFLKKRYPAIFLVLAVIGVKVAYLEMESDALSLLKIIWKNIAKKPKNEIDDILRGPPDEIKQDDKLPFGNDDEALQVLKLIREDIVKMADKTRNIIRGPAAPNSKDTSVPSLGNEKTSHSSRILFVAAEMGNTDFLVELIRLYPDLMWKVNDNNQTIFHVAVEHRREHIYNILYEVGSMKELITPLRDGNDNNMLHLVGKMPKKERLQHVPGVVLQMQRELLWFREVETMIPPSFKEEKNKDGLTPRELFTKEHKDLVTQAETWMKNMASQFIVVASLIATIVFAVAFTIPGGYSQNDGMPIFYRHATFVAFVVADAISFLLSTASILLFLNILSSQYDERDFLEKIPRMLIYGLQALSLSISTMTITFILSFFVLYNKDLQWLPIFISVCAPLPAYTFIMVQYPLIAEIFRATYGSRYLFRPLRTVLYY